MSAPTDTRPSDVEQPLPVVPLEDEPVFGRVRELVANGLPPVRWAGAGHDTAILRASTLDDLLAWAGEMSSEPHWWVLRDVSHGSVDVYAAGFVQGLAVSIAAATTEYVPARVTTADVMAASELQRHARRRAGAGARRADHQLSPAADALCWQ